MVKYVVFAVVALFVLQGVVARARPKAAEKSQLEELAANAQNLVNNVTSTLQGNLPDSKKVVEVLNTNAQNLANSMQTVVDEIKKKVKDNEGGIDTFLKQMQEKLTESAAKLQSTLGPEGQKQAKDIKANLDKGLKEAVAQVEKLSKAIEPEAQKVKTDLTNAAKTFLDQIVEVSNNLNQQVKATLEEKH